MYQNILFIDTQVANYEELIQSVNFDTEVILVDSSQNGISVITSTLAGRRNLQSIQIISHGSSGNLQLGSTWLNSQTLQDNSAKIRSWGETLTENGDILFLGCNLVADEIGLNLIQQISQLTGADVAASEDITGSAALGGDWDLEANVGEVETTIAIEPSALNNYDAILFTGEGLLVTDRTDNSNTIVVEVPNYPSQPNYTPQSYYTGTLITDGLIGQSIEFRVSVDDDVQVYISDKFNVIQYSQTSPSPSSELTTLIYDNNGSTSVNITSDNTLDTRDNSTFQVNKNKYAIRLNFNNVGGNRALGFDWKKSTDSDFRLVEARYLFPGPLDEVPTVSIIPLGTSVSEGDTYVTFKIQADQIPTRTGGITVYYKIQGLNELTEGDLDLSNLKTGSTLTNGIIQNGIVQAGVSLSSENRVTITNTTTYIQIPLINDSIYDPNEQIKVSLESGAYTRAIPPNLASTNFNGVNNYVSTFTSLNTGNPTHTIEAWVYLDRLPTSRAGILELGQYGTGGLHWLVGSNGQMQIGVYNGNQIAGSPTLTVGQWTHLATVFNGTNLTFYVNGVQFGQVAANLSLSNSLLTLGQGLIGESYFPGKIRDVRVWNTARSATDISNNKNNPFVSDQSGLIGNYIASPYVNLDGNDNYILADSSGLPSGTISHTVEAWVYLDQTPTNNNAGILFLGQQGAGALHWIVNDQGKMEIGVWDGAKITTTQTLSTEQWTHLATTFDSTTRTLTLYINGTNSGQITNANLNFNSDDLILGKALPWNQNFDGKIRDIRVWNTVRSATEISNNKDQFLNGSESGLLRYYQGNASGTSLLDSRSQNPLNATLYNGAFSQFDSTVTTILDNEPQIRITRLADKIEGEKDSSGNRLAIKDVAKIELLDSEGNLTTSTQQFDLWLRITGTAIRGTFTNPAANTDYKLYYTAYDGNGTKISNRSPLAPDDTTPDVSLNVPLNTQYITIQVEDINNDIFEPTEDITIELRDNVVNNEDKYGVNSQNRTTINLLDNEPIVTLGNVVNPTEGFFSELGLFTTIANLEDALTFNGGEYLSVAGNNSLNLNIDGKFTQEAWIFPQYTADGTYGIIGYNSGNANGYPSISLQKTGTQTDFVIGFGDGTTWNTKTVAGSNITNFNANGWNHIATTFDGTRYKLYVNAVEVFSTNDFAGKKPAATQQLEIGKVGNNYFKGAIDEVRMWNVARSAGDIQNSMIDQLEGTEEGLISYWTFNNNLNDQTVNANNGTYNGTPTKYLSFDGQNDYLSASLTGLYTGNTTHTIEAWVNLDELPQQSRSWLLGLGQQGTGAGHWIINPDGVLRAGVWDGNQVTYQLKTNQWTHLATVFNGTNLTLYVNGQQVDQTTANFNFLTNTLNIGKRLVDGEYFKGQIRDIRVWKTARTQAEINNNKDSVITANSNLLAYYKDYPVSGTTLTDSSGQNNNATLNNGVTIGTEGIEAFYVNNPAPQIGYVEVILDKPVEAPQGLWVKYDILSNGNAVNGTDYFNSRYRKVSGDRTTERNGIIIPKGESSGRIYFSAISDAISEGNERFAIQLIRNNFDNESSTDQFNYSLGSNTTATITIKDNQAYKPGVILLDQNNQIISDLNKLVIRNGIATFKVELSSQPSDNANVELIPSRGSLNTARLSFNSTNWNTPQTVTLTGVTTEGIGTITVTGSYFTGNKTFSFTTNPDLRVTEGSATEAIPVTPQVSILSQGNMREDSSLSGNFVVNLSAPAPKGGIDVNYTISGNATSSVDYQGIGNYALSFDGTNDYVSTNLTGLNTGAKVHTIEAWVYLEQPTAQNKSILLTNGSSNGSLFWVVDANDTMRIGVLGFGSEISYTAFQRNQWIHLATVFDGTNLTLYANGQQVGQPVNANSLNLQISNLTLGNQVYSWTNFKGKIRDVRVWNIERTQAEINNNKNTILNGNETGLVAYYQGQKTNDNSLTDSSGNNNHGTLVNGTSYVQLNTGTLTIPEGETRGIISVLPISDRLTESNETVTVSLTDGNGYTRNNQQSSATVTIIDDDPATLEVVNADITGRYINFDGIDDYVSFGNISTLPTNASYTIEAWINPDQMGTSATNPKTIIGWGNYGTNDKVNVLTLDNDGIYHYWWGSDNNFRITKAEIAQKISNFEFLNQWHHVAVNYDSTIGSTGKITVFVDGINIKEFTPPRQHSLTTTNNLTIGSRKDSTGTPVQYFDGSIRDVRIWNTARTQTQIQDNKNKTLKSDETGLVTYYQGNASSNSLINSATNTGSVANGTLTNGATSQNIYGYSNSLIDLITNEPYPSVGNVVELRNNQGGSLGSITLTQAHIDSGKITITPTSAVTANDVASLKANLKENSALNVGLNINNEQLKRLDNGNIEIELPSISSQAYFAIRLQTKPSGNVTIQFSNIDTTEGSLDKTTVTFTPQNWETYQIVTVTGVDDTTTDGDISHNIKAEVTSTTDTNYQGKIFLIPVKNLDDDEKIDVIKNVSNTSPSNLPTVTISNPVAISEGNNQAQVQFNLSTAATQNLEVLFDISGGTATLNQDYNLPQGTLIYAQPLGIKLLPSPFDNVDVGTNSSITFVDLDKDSDLDAVLGSNTGLKYYQNIGGSFTPVFQEQTATNNPFVNINFLSYKPAFGDINGDGALDFIVGKDDGTLAYYLNTGTGSSLRFQLPTELNPIPSNPVTGIDVGNKAQPLLIDWDKDGQLDLIVGSDSGISYYRNTGTKANAIFTNQSGTSNPFNGINTGTFNSPFLSDWDKDGDLDLLLGKADGSINYYQNNSGIFSLNTVNNPFLQKDNTANLGRQASPTLADLDGDGDLDAFVGNVNGTIDYYEQFNVVTFAPGETTKTINITAKEDQIAEGKEDIKVSLYQNTGYSANYINFDGIDDYVSTSNTGLTTGTQKIHTLEAWVYLDQLPTNRAWLALLGQNGGGSHHWLIGSNGSMQIGVYGGSQIAGSPTLEVGKWTHLATVFDGTNLTLYINGVKFGSSVAANFNFTNTELGLGKIIESPFKGKIRDVRVWNTARTETQIQANKDILLNGNETGLVTYYKGNASGTSLTNSVTNGVSGTLNNGATSNAVSQNSNYQLGSPQTYINFDGTDDYVSTNLTGLNTGTKVHTIEAWVYLEQPTAQNKSILLTNGSSNGSLFWVVDANDTMRIGVLGFGSEISYTAFQRNQWIHLATVFDGTNLTLYANGQQVGQPVNANSLNLQISNLTLGNQVSQWTNFKGKIKDVRVWNTARTQTQIQTNKDNLLNSTESGLVAYYKGDSANGSLIDSSINQLNGQLLNGAGSKSDTSTTININDNDTAGVTITKVSGTNTSETGDIVSYNIRLNSQPIAPVTVYLGSQDETEGLLAKDSSSEYKNVVALEFTPNNWNQNQAVFVKGVDDRVDDGDLSYKIITTPISEDLQYNKLSVNQITLSNTDNDQVGFTINGAGRAVEGRENVYSIKLNSQPVGDIRVIMTPTNDQIRLNNEFIGQPLTLTFTPDNWNLEQTVRATALDDSVVEYLHFSKIDFKVETGQNLDFESKSDNDEAKNTFTIQTTNAEVGNTSSTFSDLGTVKGSYTWNNLQLSGSTDQDWFKFILPDTGKEEDFAQISFTHTTGDLTFSLYLESDLSNAIETSNSSDSTNNQERISLNGRPAGTYYLKVATASTASTNYNLLVSHLTEAIDLGEIKGGYTNKNLAIEPVFKEGSTPESKVLVSNDVDWFKFTIPDTGNVQDFVEIQFNHSQGDLKFELYRASNLTTPISSSNTSSASNNKERIELNGFGAGEYYLKVSGINDDITNQYDLLIADEDYKFTQIPLQPLNVIIEDNDKPTARIIAGPTASEVFGQPSYFTIQLNAPAPLNDNGINVNYLLIGGTAILDEDTNSNGILDSGEDKNSNGQLDIGDYRIQKEGSVRIAPGDIQNNLIVVPIDDKLVEDLNLTVTSLATNASSSVSVGKKLLSVPILIVAEGQSTQTIASGTKIKFNNNVVAKVTDQVVLTLNNSNQTFTGNINVEVDNDVEILQNARGKISSENVIVQLLPGEGYVLPENPQATLEIQDDDVPGVRIVQVGDNTVVREGETATFEISLLSEPKQAVTITLTPGAEIEFDNPNDVTVLVDKDVYEFDEENITSSDTQYLNYFKEFIDIKLNSLVTTDEGKTISFDVKLRSQPSCLHITFDDGFNADIDTDSSEEIEFSASEETWDQVHQVVLTNLNPDSNGDYKIKATIGDRDIYIPITHTIEQIEKETITITIEPQDWYKLQTITIKGSEDDVTEPGLYHQSQINYTISSGDSSYNGVFLPEQLIDVVDQVLSPEDTADAVQEGLSLLQQSLESLEIPLIGSLKGKLPPLISEITDQLAVAISSASELTGEKLSGLIEDALSSIGLDFINVTVETNLESIAILLEVKKEYNLFSLSLDTDLGLDALGISLTTEGKLKSDFNLDVGLGFGIHKDFGFYIDTEQTKVEAEVKLNLEDFKGQGNLGFLRLDFQDDVNNKDANGNPTPNEDNPTELSISFKAGINDLDNYQNVQFLDVDGDGLLDVKDAFSYGIKKDTDKNGKADTNADGTFITQSQSIKEPLTNIGKNGQAEDFPKVNTVSDEAKRVNWNNYGDSNNTFTEEDYISNEGIYRTLKNANNQVTGYYFDLDRNGSQDSSGLESILSIQATSTKWIKNGKVKEFRIEKKKVNGKIQYYFDKDGDAQIDDNEKITEKQKKKYDQNNNLKLDADVTIEGEGTFVQGAGIAFKDLNKNGKLDSAEYSTVVNSNFGELTISDDAISSIEYWDINNNNRIDESTDFRVRTTDDEIRYLDLNRNGNLDETEPQSASEDEPFLLSNDNITTLGKTIKNDSSNPSNLNGRYVDWDSDNQFDISEPYSCDPEELFAINLSTNEAFIDLNGNGLIDSNEKKVKTNNDDGSRYLDLDGDNTQDTGEPGSASEDEPLSVGQIPLNTTTITINGNTYNVIIKDRVQFVDLDGNGELTVDGDDNPLEPTAEPNNDFGKENPNDLLPIRYNPDYTKFLDDGDRLTLTELRNFKNDEDLGFADLFTYQLAGNANLGLITVTSIEGDPAFPSITFDLAVGLPLFNYGNQDEAGGEEFSVEFNDITLDFGTFLTKFANPIVETVDDIISPVKPVLGILNADTKIFSYLDLEDEFDRDNIKGVSILDIAQYIADLIPEDTTDTRLKRIKESVPKVVKFVGAVQQIVDTVESLKAITASDGSLAIELGSYSLDDLKAASDDQADTTSKVNASQQGTKTPAKNTDGTVKPSPLEQTNNASSANQKSAFSKLKNLEGLEIPLLSDPNTLVRILLGESDVDLITYDIPDLDLYFQRDFEFPILSIPPVIKGILGLGFEAKTDLAVGYDTHGLEEWRDSDFDIEEVYKVLDGFYLNDWQPDGTEKDEFSASASIIAGLSASLIVIKAVLQGGITGGLGFDLVDIGELQGENDGKIRGSEIISRIKTPLQLFNLQGQLDAFASGAIKVGIDAGVFEIMQTVWGIDIGPITLAKFNVGASGISLTTPFGSISNSYINGATVFFDANFNGIWDVGDDNNPTEPITFTNEYGQYNLSIGLEWDRNQDGAIDYLDGQIISIGGYDTSSGTPAGKFIGLPGSSMITPLTSIQAPLVLENGLTPETAEELIKTQLGLDPNFNLESFDPLNAVGQNVNLGLDIYLAHIQVQAIFNHARALVDALQGDNADPNNLQLVESAFANFLLQRSSILGEPVESEPEFLLQRSSITDEPIDMNSKEAILSFYSFLIARKNLTATPEQLNIIAQFLSDSNQLIDKVAEVGTSKSLKEAIPALASVKRVVQAEIPIIIKDFIAGEIDKEKALSKFDEAINQNYTLVSDDINSFGNRSVKVITNTSNLNENSSESTYITIQLSHPAPHQGLTVLYSISGTSTIGEDYNINSPQVGQVYIPADHTEAKIEIISINDEVVENLETISLNLTGIGEGYLLDPTSSVALIRIIDDEENNPLVNFKGELITGTFGDDLLTGTSNGDRLQGLYGNDTINGEDGDDFIQGGHSQDSIFGGSGNDHLEGNFGDDKIEGNGGKDYLDGGSGDDFLQGGSEFDIIFGDAGNDHLEGNSGNDQLEGGSDNDYLDGGEDNDWLSGNEGDDILIGNQGDDVINGGQGKDAFFFNSLNEGFDTILDFNPDQGDIIQISRSGFGVDTLEGFRFISGILDFEGKNLALIQNNGQTYSYFPDLNKIIKIVDEPTISTNLPKNTLTFATSLPPFISMIEPDNTTILDDIVKRGHLKVAGYFDIFDRAFVRSLAVALFGDSNKVEFIGYNDYPDAFSMIANGDVDLTVDRVTHNLIRDTEYNVDFTPLYLYDSQTVMIHKESQVDDIFGLSGKTIGLVKSSNTYNNLNQTFEELSDFNGNPIIFEPKFYDDLDQVIQAYLKGEVDAFSVDKILMVEFLKYYQEHQDEYSFKYDPSLENQTLIDVEISKEPIGGVIRENDSTWADFVRWVNYIPIQAEEFGINSQNVDQIFSQNLDQNPLNHSSPDIRRFLGIQDDIYRAFRKFNVQPDFVVKIIKEIGNYGEIYNQYFPELNRDRNELWSNGGLIYSPSFSGFSATIPLINNNSRNVLTEVLNRGKLIFATNGTNPGFSFPDDNGNLVGFDIDLGKALAAALFGNPQAIEIKQTTTIEEFIQNNPANGLVDVAAFQFTDNIVRDTQYGIDFINPYMYADQGILTRKDNGILNIPTLNGRKIGVIDKSTSSENLKNALAKNSVIAQIIEYPTSEALANAYLSQEVEAVSHDIPLLYSAFPFLPDPENHHLLNVKLGKEPLAMVIDENQSDWKDVVSWVQNILLQAEEYGITQANIDQLLADNTDNNPNNDSEAPIRILLGLEGNIGEKLGIRNDFVVQAIKAVGNYGEIYQRHFDQNILPRGFNELSRNFGLQIPHPLGINIDSENYVTDILYVVDVSGSSVRSFDGMTALKAQIHLYQELTNKLFEDVNGIFNDTEINIGIVTYSGQAVIVDIFDLDNNDDRNSINSALSGLKSQRMNRRKSIFNGSLNGTTNYDDALDKAIDFFSNDNIDSTDVMFFAGVGNPNVSGDGDGESADNQGEFLWRKRDNYRALQFDSELEALNDLGVERFAIDFTKNTKALDIIASNEMAINVNNFDDINDLIDGYYNNLSTSLFIA